MKKLIVLIIALCAGLVAFADVKTENKSVETLPILVKSVSPIVNEEFANTKLVFSFVVNEQGKVEGVMKECCADKKLAAVIGESIKQWEFKPATLDGKPVAVKVKQPVFIVLR